MLNAPVAAQTAWAVAETEAEHHLVAAMTAACPACA